jgi:hypothetical protein
MATCNAIQAWRTRCAALPEADWPVWIRHPYTPWEFDISMGVLGQYIGVEPICEEGVVTAWSGIRRAEA